MGLNKLFIEQIQLHGIHQDILKRQAEGLTLHMGEYFGDLSEN